jgi:hypothetical protein
VGSAVTLLEVVRVHHEVLREILEATPPAGSWTPQRWVLPPPVGVGR